MIMALMTTVTSSSLAFHPYSAATRMCIYAMA